MFRVGAGSPQSTMGLYLTLLLCFFDQDATLFSPFLFFKGLFYFLIVYMCVCGGVCSCVCAHECKCPQRSEEAPMETLAVVGHLTKVL